MTLVEFLRARLDEDEAAAKAWLPFGNPDAAARVHIARLDPGRVLREVEAKRRLIADYEVYDASARYPDSEGGIAIGLGTAVELAALAYADHPDYDEAWRP